MDADLAPAPTGAPFFIHIVAYACLRLSCYTSISSLYSVRA